MSGRSVLELMGWHPHTARQQALRFRTHSNALLRELAEHLHDETALVAMAKQGRMQLEEQWARERAERRTRRGRAGDGFTAPPASHAQDPPAAPRPDGMHSTSS
jgi:glutathione-regulated potassium-efflux system ancillary protein KefC